MKLKLCIYHGSRGSNKVYFVAKITQYTKDETFTRFSIVYKRELKNRKLSSAVETYHRYESFEEAQTALNDYADEREWRYIGEQQQIPHYELNTVRKYYKGNLALQRD